MSGSSSKSSVTATLRWEIVIVLAVTFGMSGLRATLRLVEALASPTPLKGQTAQLNPSQAPATWLDMSLQVLSAGTLVAWGSLAVYMLWVHPVTTNPLRFLRWSGLSDVWHGLAVAAAIGLPGLCFYGVARAWGLSATVGSCRGGPRLVVVRVAGHFRVGDGLGRGSGRRGVAANPLDSVWCVGGATRGGVGAVERPISRVPGPERGRGERDHGPDFWDVF